MQVNIKRLLSFLVVLAMVLSMVPVTGIPAIEAKAETATTTEPAETTEPEETTTTPSYTDALVFQEDSKIAYCPVCKDDVEWIALSNSRIGDTTAEKTHYYLAEDSAVTAPFINFKGKHTICLHLNGKNLGISGANSEGITVQTNGTLNVMGEGTIKRTSNGILFKVWSCTLNLYSGTYMLSPNNYGITAPENCQVMQTNGSGSKVTLYNNASLLGTVKHQGNWLALAEGWNGQIGNLQVADTMWSGNSIKNANLKVNGSLTGTVVYDQAKMVLADGLLTKGETKLTANEYCQTCGKYVAWTELKNGQKPNGTSDHYYLSEDNSTTDAFISGANYKQGSASPSVCLRLNGKTLTTKATTSVDGAIYGSNKTTINIFGEGGTVINTGAAPLFTTDTSRVNLFGGTYISETANATNIRGSNSSLYLYDDAKIKGTATVSNGNVYLNDTATIKALNKTGGTITATEGWTGSLKKAGGKYLQLVEGSQTEWTEVTKTPEQGLFEPEACDGKAYCEVCGGEPVLWTARKGNSRIEYVDQSNEANHYYLTGDLTEPLATGQVAGVTAGLKMCVNLNGYDITAPGQAFVVGTMSFFGDGNFTFTGDTTKRHETQGDIYRNAGFYFASATGVLNLFGGTYSVAGQAADDGKPVVLGNGTLNIKNATVNGCIKDSKVKLEGSAIAEDINIVDGGEVTVAAGWSGTANLTVADSAFENGELATTACAVDGAFSGKLTCNGKELTYKNGVLMTDTTFKPEAGTNYCAQCKKFVAWTALKGDVKIGTVQTEQEAGTDKHEHYYLSGDVNYTGTDPFVKVTRAHKDNRTPSSVCLNLNGYNLTTKGKIEVGSDCDLAIFGEGSTITYTGTSTWVWGTCNLRLFGGTYKGVIAQTEGGTPKLYLKDGVSVTGNLNLYSGTLWLYDTSSIKNVTFASSADYNNHKIILDSSWTGDLALDATIDIVDGKVPPNRVEVAGGKLNGKVVDAYAFAYTYDNGQLVLNSKLDPNVFAPWDSEEGYAYCSCVLCRTQKPVQWVDFNKFVAKNGNDLYVDGVTPTYHFYLSDDLTYNDHVLHTHENIVLNLNGHDISPVRKKDATAITATYAFFSTQKLILMNTSPDMSTVTGWSSEAGKATVIWMNGGASGATYLMDNVTLTTHKDCTTDAPVARIAGNGAKFYMEGGVIDVSNKVNIDYPTAVYLQGKTTVNAEFHMNGGEIKGGTSVNAGGAVQVGSRATGDTYLDGACFYMNGGTISGGKAASGGNIYINKNAKEVEINGTVTGGEATVSGGNIYSTGANLTIGKDAVISDGLLRFTDLDTAGIGGGNIYFANGTLTTSGLITGGTVEKFKGAGGNIFLDGNGGDISFVMNGGEISNGKLPFVNEPKYDNADFGGQSYGANIRGYKVKEIKLLGGTITGGQGGCPEKADGRDVYISCDDSVETKMTIGDVTINGAVQLAKHKLTLTGAPKIKSVDDGKNALTVGPDVVMDISGLTADADIELSNIVANIPLTVACDNAEALKAYFTVIGMDGAVLNVVERQLMVKGVAIVNGEKATWYATAAEAIAEYTADDYAAGKYIQLGLEDAVALPDGEYLIDLAGHVAGEVAISGTGDPAKTVVHLFDSANTDFDVFRTVTVADTVTLAERDYNVFVNGEYIRYITVTAGGKTSAHRLDMAVNGVTLNTENAGLYYNAAYKCDEYLAEMISAYGVILSVKDMPGTVLDSTDQRTVLTNFAPVNNTVTSTSSSVVGIFKEDRTPELNAELGKMKIYANAYIELNLDGNGTKILVADNENVDKQKGNAWSLHDVLFEIDQNWDDNAAIQGAAKDFFDAWFDRATTLYAEDFQNLNVKVDVEGGKGEGVTEEDDDVSVPM